MKNILSNKAYDVIKWVALIAIPTLGEAYLRLAEVLSLPYGQQVSEIAQILTWMLGVLIGVSTIQYNKNKES